MHERDLEKVMRDFVAQRYNILLCTTIIETGIDVPTANTILMHRADKFGLSAATPITWSRRSFTSSSLRVFISTRRC